MIKFSLNRFELPLDCSIVKHARGPHEVVEVESIVVGPNVLHIGSNGTMSVLHTVAVDSNLERLHGGADCIGRSTIGTTHSIQGTVELGATEPVHWLSCGCSDGSSWNTVSTGYHHVVIGSAVIEGVAVDSDSSAQTQSSAVRVDTQSSNGNEIAGHTH